MTAAVWFRRDLRLTDNPAWAAAAAASSPQTPLFIVDPRLWDGAGPHRRTQLTAHLHALDAELQEWGGRLCVRRGDPAQILATFDAVYWNADYTPYATFRDKKAMATVDHPAVFHGTVVHPPGEVLSKTGEPYKVFTPYHKAWAAKSREPGPEAGNAAVTTDTGAGLPDLEAKPLMAPGSAAAHGRLEDFCQRVDAYPEERDRPDLDTTSRLSADLKYGTISPRTVAAVVGTATPGRAAYVRQLCWRDFYTQVMFAFPHTRYRAMREEYDNIQWDNDADALEAWQRGATGYPIVDAGMRQLLTEGWMHNRVRMIAASFLVKDLLGDWRLGERYFRRLLVDGDLAQNIGNWQWVAGTGTDAAPYFRIFNPVTQGRKFDPAGDYVRRYVPELAQAPAAWIHAPWTAGPLELAAAGVTLGGTYPEPIVDHAEARQACLDAYRLARGD